MRAKADADGRQAIRQGTGQGDRPVGQATPRMIVKGLPLASLLALALGAGLPLRAAEGVWIQIEARPDRPQAEMRAQDWMGRFPGLAGFRMRSGWYGLALGPFTAETAAAQLAALKAEGRIPADSYIERGRRYGAQFWPAEGAAIPAPITTTPLPPAGSAAAGDPAAPDPSPALPPVTAAEPAPAPDPAPDPAPPVAAALPPAETPADSRAAEAGLSREARAEIQQALAWAGFDPGAADGAFGPATRAAMARWQAARSGAATGILTTAERAGLLAAYRETVAALGLTEVANGPAGIAMTLPAALFGPPEYDPPFIRYPARETGGPQLVLISSPDPADYGTAIGRLPALLPGATVRHGDQAFSARLRGEERGGEAVVVISDGLVKGWVLSWPTPREAEIAPALERMRTSFRPIPERALDPSHAQQSPAARAALLVGLQPERPARASSGLRLGGAAVLTTSDAVAGCGSITAAAMPATIHRLDAEAGIALLSVAKMPGPGAVFSAAPLTGRVAVAGYSTGPSMSAAALSRTTAARGPAGVTTLAGRIAPGDEGGPIFDAAGHVLGLVLGQRDGAAAPRAADLDRLRPVLEAADLPPPVAVEAEAVSPAELLRRARAVTVRVLCLD